MCEDFCLFLIYICTLFPVSPVDCCQTGMKALDSFSSVNKKLSHVRLITLSNTCIIIFSLNCSLFFRTLSPSCHRCRLVSSQIRSVLSCCAAFCISERCLAFLLNLHERFAFRLLTQLTVCALAACQQCNSVQTFSSFQSRGGHRRG